MDENKNTGVTTPEQNKQALAPWKKAVSSGMTKFAMIDNKRAKIEAGFASQIIEGSPSLQKLALTPIGFNSIVNSVLNVARMGITLNPAMKLAYLIPRKGLCILDPSYMGLTKILTDGKDVKYISAALVYDDEDFEFIDATNVRHVIKYAKTEAEQKARTIKGALSCAILRDDKKVYEFMPMWELEKAQRMSAGVASGRGSAYDEWASEMYKKTVIRRHYKYLPKGTNSDAVSAVIESDEAVYKQASEKSIAVNPFGEETTEEATYEEVDTTTQGEAEKPKLQAAAEPDEKKEEPAAPKQDEPAETEQAASTVTPSLKSIKKSKPDSESDRLFS